jgi:hypothetical protein
MEPNRPSWRRRLITLVATLVPLVAIMGFAFACASPPTSRAMVFPPSGDVPMPIPISNIDKSVPFKVGRLPPIALKECKGRTAPVRLLAAYGIGKQPIMTLSYSQGLWLRFSKPPFAGGLRASVNGGHASVATVRGYRADVDAMGDRRPFFCGHGFVCSEVFSDRSGARWYPLGAQLRWIENGVNVYLQGPFDDDVLKHLADQIRFPSG